MRCFFDHSSILEIRDKAIFKSLFKRSSGEYIMYPKINLTLPCPSGSFAFQGELQLQGVFPKGPAR